jgi:hypothetical protein
LSIRGSRMTRERAAHQQQVFVTLDVQRTYC